MRTSSKKLSSISYSGSNLKKCTENGAERRGAQLRMGIAFVNVSGFNDEQSIAGLLRTLPGCRYSRGLKVSIVSSTSLSASLVVKCTPTPVYRQANIQCECVGAYNDARPHR